VTRARPLAPTLPLLLALALLAGCKHVPDPGPVPELRLMTVDGAPFALSSLRGKVVLVGFFATWCFPCVAETEVLQQFARAHPDAAVVQVGLDREGVQVLKPFRDQFEVRYPVLVADDETRDGRGDFGVIRELPTTFVIDRDGHVQAAFTGVPDATKLDQALGPLLRP
jgi:peroxiredoxin